MHPGGAKPKIMSLNSPLQVETVAQDLLQEQVEPYLKEEMPWHSQLPKPPKTLRQSTEGQYFGERTS
jgi:hypothetical protein